MSREAVRTTISNIWNDDQYRGATLFLCICLGGLFLLGYLDACAGGILLLFLFLGSIPLIIGFILASVVMTIRSVKASSASSGWARVGRGLMAPLAITLVVLCGLPALWAGNVAGMYSVLAVKHRHYEHIIASVKREHGTGYTEYRENDGVTFIVDYGPPVRIAFNPDGFLDNWAGIIFDPTGDVMQADGFDKNGKFAAPDRITKLFGGDLVECRALIGSYYKCSFT
jgi:hypothetical protein